MKTTALLFSAVLLVGTGGRLHAQPAPADPPYTALDVFGSDQQPGAAVRRDPRGLHFAICSLGGRQ